jgi:hypothetical protein
MRKSLLAALAVLSGCAYTPELTVIAGPRWSEGERDTAVTFMLVQRHGEHIVSGCAHNSLPSRGAPFNDEYEVTFDHCGPGVRFGGKRK